MPAGPGGLTPSISLSYSSGTSDGTSGERAKWQAGWTGKGWSLDAGGYVALNKSGVGDGWNNFSLVFGGQSFDIIKGAPLSGYTVSDPALDHWSWHAVDDQFTKIAPEFNGNVTVGTAPNTATYATYIWHAWTKDGNRYDFGLNNGMLWWTNDLDTREVYKWLLIKETDTHGNKILYDYQVDSVDKALHNVVAPYHYDYHLNSISWAYDGALAADAYGWQYRTGNPRYQVLFTTADRQTGTTAGVDSQWDFPSPNGSQTWKDSTPHETYRLDTITVQSKSATSFDRVRQYNLSYAAAANSLQTDDYTGQKVLTLTNIEKADKNGNIINVAGAGSPRPFLTSFTYYTDPGAQSDTRPDGFNRLNTIDNGQGGKLTFTYEHAFVKNSTDPSNTPPTNEWYLYRNIYRLSSVLAQDLSGTGKSTLTDYSYLYPAVNDYGHAATVVFARFPPSHNGDSRQWLARPEKHEFRGHYQVTVRQYDGATTGATLLKDERSWFYQGNGGTNQVACSPVLLYDSSSGNDYVDTSDSCFLTMTDRDGWKGRAIKSEIWNASGSNPIQRTLHQYDRIELPSYGDASSATASNNYRRVGLWRAFNYEKQTDVQTFNGTASVVTQTTKTFYNSSCAADTQSSVLASYGNPLCVQEYDGSTLLRTTKNAYTPRDTTSGIRYLVDRMWQSAIYNGSGNIVALTNQFYDNVTDADTVPTLGELRRTSRYYDVPGNTSTTTGLTLHSSDTSATYDAWGNQATSVSYTGASTRTFNGTSATWSALTGTSRTTTTTYDTIFHVLPMSETNPATHLTRADYDERMGLLIRVTGPNSTGTPTDCGATSFNITVTEESTCAVYDTFGRLVKVVKPGDTSASPTVQATYDDTLRPFRYRVNQKDTSADGWRAQAQFYDGLGRKIQTKAESDNGSASVISVVTDTRYDGLNRVVAQGQPFYKTESTTTFPYTAPGASLNNQTTTTYDSLGRPLTVVAPDTSGTRTTSYGYGIEGSPLRTVVNVIDPLSHSTRSRSDAFGRRVQVVEDAGPTTTYAYDALDELISVTDAAGNVTTMDYDSAGRKTSMDDPDMGAWSYTYYPTGTLASQTDPKNQTINFYYDALDRLTGKALPGGWTSSFAYDSQTAPSPANAPYAINYGKGQRTSMSTALNGTTQTFTRWEYDARGRTTLVGQSVAGVAMNMLFDHDVADRVVTQTYNGEALTTTYDDGGRPVSLCSSIAGQACYVSGAIYTPEDQPEAWTDGNSVPQDWIYEATTGRLSRLKIGTGTTASFFDRTYGYDDADNITSITDNRNAANNQTFGYDTRDRLTCWKLNSTSCTGTYTFNTIGNLTSKTSVGVYTYPASGATSVRPHTPSSVNGSTYTYDANGNLTSGGGRSYTWTAENLPATITSGATETYTYDADGERIAKAVGGATTIYFQGLFEQTISAGWKQYYSFNGHVVAVRDSATGVNYLHGDHLGSVSLATTSTGTLASQQEFDPWGDVRTGSVGQTSLNYTGQRLDGTGLLYYHARMYDPVLARFVSADSIVPGASTLTMGPDKQSNGPVDPQQLNRYTYVNNNPVNTADPTGHCGTSGFLATAASVMSGDCTRRSYEMFNKAKTTEGKVVSGAVIVTSAVGAAAGWVGGALMAGEALAAASSIAEAAIAPAAQAVSARIVAAGAASAAGTVAAEVGGTCSFSANTPVSTENGTKAIGELKVGDHVLAYDQEAYITGSYTVTAVLVHTDRVIEYLTVGGERLLTTPEHPFFTLEKGWTPAGQLQRGDHIRRADGTSSAVEELTFAVQPQPMYNLTVAHAHTFFVGQQQLLVHNTCSFDLRQLAAKFKHAGDFGITGNWNKLNAARFQTALEDHIAGPNTTAISGTYRNTISVIHYFDRTTGLNVMADLSGKFISGWKLSPDQIKNLLNRGNVQ